MLASAKFDPCNVANEWNFIKLYLSKLTNENFTNSIFLTKAPIILNEHFNGTKFLSISGQFSVYIFGVQKMTIKNVFGAICT